MAGKAAAAPPAPADPSPTPAPAADPPATPDGSDSGGGVSRADYDRDMGGIRTQLDELKQSITHLTAAVQAGATSHAGPGAGQPAAAPGAGTPAQNPGSSGQPGGAPPAAREPEHTPRPAHRYWRPIFGS